jgi:hypothetical protein
VKRATIAVLVLLAALSAVALSAPKGAAPPPPPQPERVELDFSDEPESAATAEAPRVSDRIAIDSITIPGRWRHDGSTGDLVRFGEDIVVRAGQRVRGDVVAIGGSVEVLGIVDGDAVALGGRVRIRPGAEVRGEAISIGGQVLHEGSGALRGSSVSMPGVPGWLFDWNVMNLVGQGIKVVQLLVFLLLTLVLAWVATHVAPDRTLRAAAYIPEKPGPAFLWGVAVLVGLAPSALAVVLVGALLCITIIGIPVALLLWVGYAVALAVLLLWGYLVGASVVGRWVVRRLYPSAGGPDLWRSLLFGVAALFLPALLAAALKALGLLAPVATGLGIALSVLNWVLSSCVALLGIGAVLATRAGMPPRPAVGVGAPAAGLPPVPPTPPGAPAPPVALPSAPASGETPA